MVCRITQIFSLPELISEQVINAMQPWKEESNFLDFINEHSTLPSSQFLSMAPTTTLHTEEFLLLGRAYDAIMKIHPYTTAKDGGSGRTGGLMAFLQHLRGVVAPTNEQLFEVLLSLRAWLFWLPTMMLQSHEADSVTMAVLAQFYATALAVEPLFPVLGGAYLGSLSSAPIEEIDRILSSRQANDPYNEDSVVAMAAMEFPREMVMTFRDRLSYTAQQYEPATTQGSPYQFQGLSIGSKSTTPGSSNDPPSVYRHSFEDLTVAAPRSYPQYLDVSPRPSIRGLEERAFAGFGMATDSPAYSPGLVDEDYCDAFGSPSWSYNGGFVAPPLWT